MKTALVILLLTAACHAKPSEKQSQPQVSLSDSFQQLNASLVNTLEEARKILQLPTTEQALHTINEQAAAARTKLEEIVENVKQAAQKQQGTVSDKLKELSDSLNHTVTEFLGGAAPSVEQGYNQLTSGLRDFGTQLEQFASRVQPHAEQAWTSVSATVQEAVEKTKQATDTLKQNIDQAIQKPSRR